MRPMSTQEKSRQEVRQFERKVVFLAPEQIERIQSLTEKNYTTFSQTLREIVTEGLEHVNGG